ncbi:DUF1642 domain-containing protein [Streptococcus suis]
MKKYHVIFPNPNGEGNRIYGLVRTEAMGLRMARMGRKAFFFSHLTKLTESEIKQDFDWAWQFAKEVEEDK